MNDSKNLILAVVLSALVLLGWTWATNTFFPTAEANATVEFGIQQYVTAAAKSGTTLTGFGGYATASADIDNSGVINIGAFAYATGAVATANAPRIRSSRPCSATTSATSSARPLWCRRRLPSVRSTSRAAL